MTIFASPVGPVAPGRGPRKQRIMWTLSVVRCMYQQETALKRAKATAVAWEDQFAFKFAASAPFRRHVRELSAAPQPCLGLGAEKAPRTLVPHKPTVDIDCGNGQPLFARCTNPRIGVRLIPANHKLV
jgi:hypothetical protein